MGTTIGNNKNIRINIKPKFTKDLKGKFLFIGMEKQNSIQIKINCAKLIHLILIVICQIKE